MYEARQKTAQVSRTISLLSKKSKKTSVNNVKNNIGSDHSINKYCNIIQRIEGTELDSFNTDGLILPNDNNATKCSQFVDIINELKNAIIVYSVSSKSKEDLEILDSIYSKINKTYFEANRDIAFKIKRANSKNIINEFNQLKINMEKLDKKMQQERQKLYGEYEDNFKSRQLEAKKIVSSVLTKDFPFFMYWFKIKHPSRIKRIVESYKKILLHIDDMKCESNYELRYNIGALQDKNTIQLGPLYQRMSDFERAKTIIHETSHFCLGTEDKQYGKKNVLSLNSDDAFSNADTYSEAAGSAFMENQQSPLIPVP